MRRLLEFHWEVQPDLDSSYRWYEQQRKGLGTDFLDAVQDALVEIADHPSRYGFAERDVRQYILPQFPHAVFYRVLNERVRILAVYHAARDPSGWNWRT